MPLGKMSSEVGVAGTLLARKITRKTFVQPQVLGTTSRRGLHFLDDDDHFGRRKPVEAILYRLGVARRKRGWKVASGGRSSAGVLVRPSARMDCLTYCSARRSETTITIAGYYLRSSRRIPLRLSPTPM